MLHIATSHVGSPRWIEIQLRQLRRHLEVPYTTWASLPPAHREHAGRFDRLIEQRGPEAGRLNHLAVEISQVAAAEDLLMFLAPDAFPIADPMPLVQECLTRTALVAVRRVENGGDPQPYPCFCVTTVGAWLALAGDWSDGFPWSVDGRRFTDLGGNLLRRLQATGTEWTELRRSSPPLLDPLFFAVYGEVVYHHGVGPPTRAHEPSVPRPLPSVPGISRRLDAQRRRAWERLLLARTRKRSEAIFALAGEDRPGWEDELRAGCPQLA